VSIVFHDLFGIFVIMKKAKYYNSKFDIHLKEIINKHKIVYNSIEYPHPVLNDIHQSNLGIYNDKLVKIDYGNWYWLYNVYIDIKLYLKRRQL